MMQVEIDIILKKNKTQQSNTVRYLQPDMDWVDLRRRTPKETAYKKRKEVDLCGFVGLRGSHSMTQAG